MIRGRVQRSRGKSLPQTKLTSDGWIVDDLGTDKRETGTGRRWRAGWPVARVANDLRLCMHRRKKEAASSVAWLVYDSGNVHNFFAPLHSTVPKLGTVPFSADSVRGGARESAKTRNIPTASESQTTAAANTAPLAGPTTRHRRTPEDPPRHSRDHTGRPNRARQGASSGQSL